MDKVNVYVNEDETLDDLQLDGINLIQKKDAFRFGVDAVLLADFAQVKNKHSVMDLCTGTGIIPFVIAGKRKPKKIYGIEIQGEMVEMANRSVKINSMEDKIEFYKRRFKE